ncbi:phosphotransferase [Ruminococcus sp.]|uniref:phosphotransferase n=1 Tax=Ruminococcus sp. TaxID=41978 RepID=UPI0025D5F56D|nr:phosphotransferase [Ruminococcus sp.]MBQ8966101.1 phosphotransferase [Ruminococcus sp.]
MKTATENGTLTIFPEGRIDTNNAAKTEQEIFHAVGDSTADIVIDAKDLEYISSAGLRVLMKLRKKVGRPLPVINVSRDVYEIFETTGFTELLEIKKALREVSTEGCEVIGKGGYGTVYRLDKETILKVYNKNSRDFIDSERLMSQRAFVNGLPTAIPYDVVRSGDSLGVVYELIDASTIAQLINASPDRLEEYVRKYAAALREFHSITLDDELFHDKKQSFFETAEVLAPCMTAEEKADIYSFIESIPDRRTFIHGDYNLKNVMVKDDEVILIDIGDAGVGHPILDVGGVWLACKYLPHTGLTTEQIRGLLGIDPDLSDKVWDIFLREYFSTDAPDELAKYERMIAPAALMLVACHSLRRYAEVTEDMIKQRVENIVRRVLIPAIHNSVKINF